MLIACLAAPEQFRCNGTKLEMTSHHALIFALNGYTLTVRSLTMFLTTNTPTTNPPVEDRKHSNNIPCIFNV